MSFYKFNRNDIFTNRMKTHPRSRFVINNKKIFLGNEIEILKPSGLETIKDVPQGHLSLYEMNINRDNNVQELIYPFITKQGTLDSFKTVSTEDFQGFEYGQEISGSYPLSSSISTDYYALNSDRRRLDALKNTLNYYSNISPHYSYFNQIVGTDKSTQEAKLISIPSIFFGSSMKKGTVELNFYYNGQLASTIKDKNRNGELIQTYSLSGVGQGQVAGVVLYNEGFVVLTGTWDIHPTYTDEFLQDGDNSTPPKWTLWGQDSLPDVESNTFCPDASWEISFLGTSYISTMTMMAHAEQGHLNHSNNPTFIDYEDLRTDEYQTVTQEMIDAPHSSYSQEDLGKSVFITALSPRKYVEDKELKIANIVQSPYPNTEAQFEKTTYISKIGIYDEHKNLIAIAKLATPVKKTESRSYTFKMKLDI